MSPSTSTTRPSKRCASCLRVYHGGAEVDDSFQKKKNEGGFDRPTHTGTTHCRWGKPQLTFSMLSGGSVAGGKIVKGVAFGCLPHSIAAANKRVVYSRAHAPRRKSEQ